MRKKLRLAFRARSEGRGWSRRGSGRIGGIARPGQKRSALFQAGLEQFDEGKLKQTQEIGLGLSIQGNRTAWSNRSQLVALQMATASCTSSTGLDRKAAGGMSSARDMVAESL